MEIRRRKVVRVVVIYAAVGWLVLQVAELTFERLGLPPWTVTLVLMLAILGFPIAVTMAWTLERMPGGGIRRETPESAMPDSKPNADERDEAQPSIAVLPFLDMSPERNQDYFCEGMAEEILNALAGVEGLRVAARSSSFQFRGAAVDVRKAGRELGVNTILEGSIRKAGSQLRVTAQLINARDGYHLWSDRFDRDLADVFAIQDEIATRITAALKVKLTPQARDAIQSRTTKDLEAYDYYLRGRQLLNQFSKRRTLSALRMFERAIEIDPDYLPPYAGLALASANLYMWWDIDPAHCARAEWASAKAIELDPDSAEAHISRGIAELIAQRFDRAEQAFERAIALDPRSFDAHYYYARTCTGRGNREKAAALYEQAADARTEDYQALLLARQIYETLGRKEQARAASERGLERARRALELDPNDVRALTLGNGALRALGRVSEGRAWSERALTLEPEDPGVLYNIACFYASIDEADTALDLLERVQLPGIANRAWVEKDNDLASLRGLPRFNAFLATLK